MMCGLDMDSTYAVRCGLLVHMLGERASHQALRECLQILVDGIWGSSARPMLSELAFLTLLKSRAGPQAHDINATFIEQWLRKAHVPKFTGEVVYSPKHNRVEIFLRQIGGAGTPMYCGAIKIRVAEAQCVWDYEKVIDSTEHRWVLDCRTSRKKGKGGRKTELEDTRKKQWRNPEVLDASNLLQLAASETSKKYWEVTSPVRYVILDPDYAWMMDLTWRQPEEFWLELLHDSAMKEDIGARRFGLEQLSRTHTFKQNPPGAHLRAISAIAAIAQDIGSPDATRVHAVWALEALNNRYTAASNTTSWMGMNLILTVYKRLYYEEGGDPKTFHAKHGEYAVRPALLDVISRIRAGTGIVPEDVRYLIFDSIRMCESHEDNPYTDGVLMGSLARAAGLVISAIDGGGGGMGDDAEEMRFANRWINHNLSFALEVIKHDGATNKSHLAVGCIYALHCMGAHPTRSKEMLANSARDIPSDLRLQMFKNVAASLSYIVHHPVEWLNTLAWLFNRAVRDPCLYMRHEMLRVLLNIADTFSHRLGEGKTREGKEIALGLWDILTMPSNAYDSKMWVLCHQIWLEIWGVAATPPCLVGMKPPWSGLKDWTKDGAWGKGGGRVLVHIEDLETVWARYRAEAMLTDEEDSEEEDDYGSIQEGEEEEEVIWGIDMDS